MLRISKSGTSSILQNTMAGLLLLTATALSASCDAPASKEDLNPAGPPMVRQVLVTERVNLNGSDRILAGQLAFGSHEAKFFQNDDGQVQTAIALGAQEIRIILDELVRGNSLEEMACADGTFSRIPDGTTPDDVAKCAGPEDSLLKCTKVCINADGKPVGVLDENEDDAADDMRMIDYNPDPDVTELGVTLVCDGVAVPLDPDFSFWSPSGNQTFPSNPILGFRGLGPAIVLKPRANIGLRTGAACSITFRPEVVDYDGNQVCAPEGGSISNSCDNGDTSRLTFSSEPLKLVSAAPADMSANVALGASAFILTAFNGNIDATTIGAITLTANGVDVPINPVPQEDDKTSVVTMLGRDFEPDTEYVLTVSTELKDLLGGSLAAPATVTWTTEGFDLKLTSPSNGQDNAPMGIISLDFNGAVDPATLGDITLTKEGTPSDPAGTPAVDGVAVAITPTVDPDDSSKVLIDLGDIYEANTYYELVVGVGVTDLSGNPIPEARLVTWTTEGLRLVSSDPANNAMDVPLTPASILLTFNTAVTQASATAAISLTADGAPVVVTPLVQADGREVVIELATFTAATVYVLTITTGLQDAKGGALPAEATVTWTTVN